MQAEIQKNFHFTVTELAMFKKYDNINFWWGMDERSSCVPLVRIHCGKTTLGNNLTLSGKVKNQCILPTPWAIPLLGHSLVMFLHRCTWKYPLAVVVQSLSCVQFFATPWTTARQTSLFLHHLLELAQTHVHWVGDVIQPSRPLSSLFPPALSLSQHQGLFQWVSSSHQVAKVLEFQLQHQSFQWTPRTDLL